MTRSILRMVLTTLGLVMLVAGSSNLSRTSASLPAPSKCQEIAGCPAKEISKLRMPVLIVQGTTDIQASLQDAQALVGSNPKATLLLIDGMNHVLKTVPKEPEEQVSSYSDPILPIAPDLISGISKFVNKTRSR